jgi:hypothetical protein
MKCHDSPVALSHLEFDFCLTAAVDGLRAELQAAAAEAEAARTAAAKAEADMEDLANAFQVRSGCRTRQPALGCWSAEF